MRPLKSLAQWILGAAALATAACTSAHTSDLSGLPSNAIRLAVRPLSSSEESSLKAQGFVISPIEPTSFHAGYAALFKAHEPAYFTADALLHALHRSFDKILQHIETSVLTRDLDTLLTDSRKNLALEAAAPAAARADADIYLAVAKSLLDEKPAPPVAGGDAQTIANLASAAQKASGQLEIAIFGSTRLQDFSLFTPRGHYTRSEALKRYFRAMVWLGTVDARLAEQDLEKKWVVNRGAIAGALVLQKILSPAARAAWQRIERTTAVFVGPPDSMSFPGLEKATSALGLASKPLDSISDADFIQTLQPLASQRIRGGLATAGEPPLSFLPLGQRFVFDSLVFMETTYGNLRAKRLMPSPLDVAAAVFRNPAAEPLLAKELDRYQYRDALTAVTREGDRMGPELWSGSIYHGWLRALRELSPSPERDKTLPSVFRSEAWQRRMLSSQLASWAELRHDTVLYAKQSFTAMILCEYPDGYVDPYPSFFATLAQMAAAARALIDPMDFASNSALKTLILQYFEKLAEVSRQLQGMAERERQNQPLTDEQVLFLNNAVALRGTVDGCAVQWSPEGWYSDLYFDRDDVLKHEPIISDVHTQPTDEVGNMVGHVLHAATGHPRLITVRIETCHGPKVFRGLVASYHEVTTSGFDRLTDERWWERLRQKDDPPEDPPWTKDFVAQP
jgi:hypothetical protein